MLFFEARDVVARCLASFQFKDILHEARSGDTTRAYGPLQAISVFLEKRVFYSFFVLQSAFRRLFVSCLQKEMCGLTEFIFFRLQVVRAQIGNAELLRPTKLDWVLVPPRNAIV